MVPAFTIQHFISHTLLINFNYRPVSKTAETNASRPRPQVPRPSPRIAVSRARPQSRGLQNWL